MLEDQDLAATVSKTASLCVINQPLSGSEQRTHVTDEPLCG